MDNLLPVVNSDICYSIVEDFDPNLEYEKIAKENPIIHNFISQWSSQQKKKGSAMHSAYCGILVYKMLHSQAEANKMAEEFNLA